MNRSTLFFLLAVGLTASVLEAKRIRLFEPSEVKKTLFSHIQTTTEKNHGAFQLTDIDRENRSLNLQLVRIHEEVKRLGDGSYFICTEFQAVGGPEEKIYDIDFWLSPDREGNLRVSASKVHKDPVQVSGKWTQKARYTFVN